ncbi:Oxidoreductase, short chain dehydrogenase/reductase family [Candidatus Rhodobacter oscarellae]|uniref:Oxidoreductase, short chain dehydrogenase/reductase family n=1 Tax=Candidatus Rhodobacter oscarellae TaxID=1675527 RepID=A0A0J9H082_9RHOB|nr:SDR family oxidoreductase [Candidatus Rhodobacter lobularis]KMW59143.1 Oxidoreductase, short chain dehydrogenase/reductase family [Candidatus Rhodobacter lobularis]
MANRTHEATGAIITGGSQGLGLAIAKRLIDEGCTRLVITSRNPEKGAAAVRELRALGARAYTLPVEMSDIPAVQAMVGQAVELIGPVNALVNCAANTARGSILDTTPDRWDEIMDPNAKGPFFALQEFARHCIAEGHTGSCVNILSIVVYGGTSFLAPYVASKAALAGITKNAAGALTKHRIRVNGINVGWMDTPGEDMRQKVSHDREDGWLDGVEDNVPFGMLVKPEHVAWQTSFLLGPASGVVTGALMDFDQQVVGAYPDTDEV